MKGISVYVFSGLLTVTTFNMGCGMDFALLGAGGDEADANGPTGLATQIAAKATTVVDQIGGDDGFGGPLLDDYVSHMEDHMGFHDDDDLGDADQEVALDFHNESEQACMFNLTYVASHLGLEDITMHIDVPAGETITVDIPCPELLGLGSLSVVGQTAVELADGATLDNMMSVPAFLGSDYACAGTYACTLMVDVDDIDGDGDTDELIVVTDALQFHIRQDGMGGHMHGGMMGGGI